MSSLFKNLRIHQIFGANTNVGKTVMTTVLVGASAARNHPVFFLKPVSTGPPQDADDRCVPWSDYCPIGNSLLDKTCQALREIESCSHRLSLYL